MYGYELDELLKQYGLSTPSNTYGGTPMPTGTTIDPLQQAAYDADQAKYKDYTKEYTNRLQNTNMYSAPQFQSPATYSDLYKKQVGNSVVPQVGTPAYENYVKELNETLKNNPTTSQTDLQALMDKYGQNRYDLVNATGSWWGDVLGKPDYQDYKATTITSDPKVPDVPVGPVIPIVPPIIPPVIDSINGGTGNDTVTKSSGTDTITGGTGNDTVKGGSVSGTGTVTGGTGNDTVTGGTGVGTSTGTITGGTGIDTVTGGTGTTGNGDSGTGTGTGIGTGSGTGTGESGTGTGNGTGTGIGTGGNGTSTIIGSTGNDTSTGTSGTTLTITDSNGNPTGATGTTNGNGVVTISGATGNENITDSGKTPTGTSGTGITLTKYDPSTSIDLSGTFGSPTGGTLTVVDSNGNPTGLTGTTDGTKLTLTPSTPGATTTPIDLSGKPTGTTGDVTLTTVNDNVGDKGGTTTPITGITGKPSTPGTEVTLTKVDEPVSPSTPSTTIDLSGTTGDTGGTTTPISGVDPAAEAAAKAAKDAQAKADAEAAQAKANAEAVARAAEEAQAKANAEAIAKAQAEANAKANAEALAKQQADALAKANAEAIAKQQAIADASKVPPTTENLAAKYDVVGPTQQTAKTTPATITDLTSAYNINPSTVGQMGPTAKEQQDAIAKAKVDEQEKAKADQAAKDAAETAAAQQAAEQKAAEDQRIADKAAADAKAATDKAEKEAADKAAKETQDAANKSAAEAKAASDKATADAKAAEKAQADSDAKAKAEADAKAKAAENANKFPPTIEDLTGKYDVINDKVGPVLDKKAQAEAQAKAESEAKVQAEKLAAEHEKAIADAKAKSDAEAAATKATADAQAKADQAAKDAKETAAAKVAADKKAAADAKAQQLAEAKAKAETDKAAKLAADKAAAEAKAEAAKSAAAAKVAADKAAADAKAEAKAQAAAQAKANAEAKAAAAKAAADAKSAALQAAKEKAAADAEAKKQAAADAKAKAQAVAIEKQKALDAAAKANPTVANLAAKYHVAPNVINAAKLLISDPTLNIENLRSQYAHIGSIEGFPRIYEIIDALKNKDVPSDNSPTVSELAKNYNVSENAIKAALLKTTAATDADIKAFLKQNPVSATESKYLDGISSAIHSKLGTIVQNAASAAGGATTGGETTPAVVKPVEIAKTTPETTAKTNQIATANDLAKQIVNATADTSNSVSLDKAKVMAVEFITLPKPEVFMDYENPNAITVPELLLKYLKSPLYLAPPVGYAVDSISNLISGKNVDDPVTWVKDLFNSADTIVSGKSIQEWVPEWLQPYFNSALGGQDVAYKAVNSDGTPYVGEETYDLGTMIIKGTTNDDDTHNFYTEDGTKLNSYNQDNQDSLFSVAQPGFIKDSGGNPIGDGKSPVAVIKLPQTNQPTEKFAEFVEDNSNDPVAIDQYIQDNGLENTHIAASIHSAQYYADRIAELNAAMDQGIADGTLQDGNLIGTDLFPTTYAAIEAITKGFVPFDLGLNLIAEVQSVLNGTNYNAELPKVQNEFRQWAAENPITAKILQTLGTLGYAEITGGANISDSMKVSSIWNEDLKENARAIAVDFSQEPLYATPIDSKGNATGEPVLLNPDRLGSSFWQDIVGNIEGSVEKLIGQIEGAVGSIEDFFTPAEEVNPIYDETINSIADLYDNPSFDYLGALAPNSSWSFPTIPNVTPGYADLSSANFWGSTLGNSYNTNFGDWGSNNIPTGWNINDFGFSGIANLGTSSPLNTISDNINTTGNWSGKVNTNQGLAGSSTLTNSGTSQYPGIDETTLAYLGFLNRG